MAYDDRALAMASRMLAPKSRGGKGQDVFLNAPASDGWFNPATDTTTAGTDAAEYHGSGVEEAYSAFSVASGVVQAGDIKFLLSALQADGSPLPQPVPDSWTLVKGGKTWAIKKVDPLSPAGTPVMFTLQLRGA